MKKLCLFALTAGFFLVSAAPPPSSSGFAVETGRGYPECSRLVTDRCIQLYERAVRTPANLRKNGSLPASANTFRSYSDTQLKQHAESRLSSALSTRRASQNAPLDSEWEAQQMRRMREGGYLILPPTLSAKKIASRSGPPLPCS
jgi:hypothetical protein